MTTDRRRPLTFIPEFLPDQTLYSWVSRYHLHSGNAYPDISVEQLFWTSQCGWNFHIPSHLDNFCASTRRIFGEPEDVIAQRTILPAYLWFRPRSVQTDVLSRLRGGATAGIPQLLGMWKQSTGTLPPRRLCPQCAQDDTASYGKSYWHRSQQIPGVAVCLHHQRPLLVSKAEAPNKHRRHFFTPATDLAAGQFEPPVVASSNTTDRLLKIGEIAVQLVEHQQVLSSHLLDVHSVLRHRLEEIGAPVEEDGKAAFLMADQAYQKHVETVADELWPLPSSGSKSSRLLGALLLKNSSPVPTLEYTAVIQWLFDSWLCFFTSLNDAISLHRDK